jgi:hypothetical protein
MPGKYTYRIEKSLYNKSAGRFEITGQEKDGKKDLPVELKPAYGTIKINTLPEQGATVLIDDVETGKLTPYTDDKSKAIRRSLVKNEFKIFFALNRSQFRNFLLQGRKFVFFAL